MRAVERKTLQRIVLSRVRQQEKPAVTPEGLRALVRENDTKTLLLALATTLKVGR